ncbi:hypothetical protein PG985_008313 [Apiospora marii]|uniref:Uncharacterized protein n=1 Tax=Apiospora marii TaxID=335849 RepID=A0ABR1SRL6_9PEZI
MNEKQNPFKPTHVFGHKYAKEDVLRTYIIETAKLREDQFRIETHDNKLQLEVIEPAKLEEKQMKEIIQLFRDTEKQLADDNAVDEQDDQD